MKNRCIDIHSHILPGVDDGARDLDMAVSMLRESKKEGVEEIILTFHFYPGKTDQQAAALDAFDRLKKTVAEEDLPKLHLGNEILYDSRSLDDVKCGRALTLGGSEYVLLEFMPGDPFEKLENAVRSFKVSGYRTVIAHAERYAALNDAALFRRLIEGGAVIQVNSGSFNSGMFNISAGKKTKKLLKLLELGLIHVVADDTHNLEDRKPRMGSVMDRLRAKGIDEKLINRVFFENPRSILKNENI